MRWPRLTVPCIRKARSVMQPAAIMAHVHDAEIEIEVGPTPQPRAGSVQ